MGKLKLKILQSAPLCFFVRSLFFLNLQLKFVKNKDKGMQNSPYPQDPMDLENSWALDSIHAEFFIDLQDIDSSQPIKAPTLEKVEQRQTSSEDLLEMTKIIKIEPQTNQKEENCEQSPVISLSQNESCLVFCDKMSQRKNPNFTKFLISAFSKETKRLRQNKKISQIHGEFLDQCRKIYEIKGKRMIKMEALQLLFGQIDQEFTDANRKILYSLLGRQDFKNYVIHNPFAKAHNIKQHLLASKVYRLRCFSNKLTGRTQTK